MGSQDAAEVPPEEVVVKFKLLPNKKYFNLDQIIREPAPVHYIRVGKGAHNDMIVHGPKVANTHCVLRVTRRGVEVSSFGRSSETIANNLEVTDGYVLLHHKSVLELGRGSGTRLMACTADSDEQPEMVVQNLYQLVQEAPSYFVNDAQAARALGIKDTTYRRWLDEHKFMIAAPLALLLALIGGSMLSPLSSRSQDTMSITPGVAPSAHDPRPPTLGDSTLGGHQEDSFSMAENNPTERSTLPSICEPATTDHHVASSPTKQRARKRSSRRSAGYKSRKEGSDKPDKLFELSEAPRDSSGYRRMTPSSELPSASVPGISVVVEQDIRGVSYIYPEESGNEP